MIEALKLKSQILRHKTNASELECKIAEREQDINRMKKHMEEQLALVSKLEQKLDELQGE